MKLFNINLTHISKPAVWLVYVVFFACLLPVAIFSYKHPLYNWDMLAYMALVVKMENKDVNKVHDITYRNIRQNIPAEDYDKLTGGGLRRSRAENPAEFAGVLPFYAIKPLYIWSSYIFYKVGFSLPVSTVLPSIVAYLFIGLLLFHWLNRHHNLFFAFVAALLIMLSSVMIDVARLSTPDCISAFLLFTAFFFILERPSVLFTFLFLTGSVLARLDNIILSGLLLSFLFFSSRWTKKISLVQYIVMLAVLAVLYILVSGMAGEYQWDSFYYSRFVKYYDKEHEVQSSFSFSHYLALIQLRVIMAALYTHFSFFLLLVLVMLSTRFQEKFRNLPFELLFCVLLVFTIITRFVLFPNLEDRFYIAYYLVILILFMRQYKQENVFLKLPGKESMKLNRQD